MSVGRAATGGERGEWMVGWKGGAVCHLDAPQCLLHPCMAAPAISTLITQR